jgi:transglycosylase-like protein with SLT domain
VTLFAMVATVAAIAVPVKKHDCQTRACVSRVAAKQCSQTRVTPCIRHAALRWRVSYPMLKRKAICESGLNPYAVGFGIHHGLFQFLRSTFATTPYRYRWIYSARYNSLAAAWMHRVGRGSEWACA